MANNWQSKTDGQLDADLKRIVSVVGADPGAYGVSAGIVADLAACETEFATDITQLVAARAAALAATQARDASRRAASEVLSRLAASLYANPNVSDAMLADAGFAPRDKKRTRQKPHQPTNLLAKPDIHGNVALTWEPSGNSYGVTYVIEWRREDSESWSFLGTTTRKRARFRGFAPGVPAWFRVTASRNTVVSAPCYPASIYSPESIPSTRLAA